MEIIPLLVIVAAVFGICYLVDKGFTKVFRNQQQHKSGTAIRLSRRYGSIGLILFVFGIAVIFSGLTQGWVMCVIGGIIAAVGVVPVVYYMTFGVFYDDEGFVLTTFGKKSTLYRYADVKAQQLYNSYGNIIIELYMTDGRSVQLQTAMEGVYTFMDKAFAAWLRQTGKNQNDCDFYDPDNCCWFPKTEEA